LDVCVSKRGRSRSQRCCQDVWTRMATRTTGMAVHANTEHSHVNARLAARPKNERTHDAAGGGEAEHVRAENAVVQRLQNLVLVAVSRERR
jgi:hypothetical protein